LTVIFVFMLWVLSKIFRYFIQKIKSRDPKKNKQVSEKPRVIDESVFNLDGFNEKTYLTNTFEEVKQSAMSILDYKCNEINESLKGTDDKLKRNLVNVQQQKKEIVDAVCQLKGYYEDLKMKEYMLYNALGGFKKVVK